MARVVRRRWRNGDSGSGLPRRDRRGCEYESYVPDALMGRQFQLTGEVAAAIAGAEAALLRLDLNARTLVGTEVLAQVLLRAEAVASSRIEGLEVGARRLLHADAARTVASSAVDVTAVEVLNNVDAMTVALDTIQPGDDITVDLLLEIHRRLFAGTRLAAQGGVFRSTQNWIGGSSFNPCAAAFVPPPPELVGALLADLCAFCNTSDLPAVAQAAIAHAQFETIHPFVDGNGRTGRVLIHLILRRRGLARRTLPPVSLVLATWSASYIEGLTATRYRGSPNARAAVDGVNHWIEIVAGACERSVVDVSNYEREVAALEAAWRLRLGPVRANSALDVLLTMLPGAPVLTVERAAKLLGRTFKPAAAAIERCVDAGILRQVTVGRRNRAYEAPDVIAAFTALERRLASPDGDTRSSEPVRPVPRGVS